MYKHYNILDQEIQKIISDCITTDDPTSREYYDSFIDFFNNFRKLLYKNDPVTGNYHKIQPVGSFYDKLTIGSSMKEYDMNVLIRLPENFTKVTYAEPGFVKIKLNSPEVPETNKIKIYNSWVDEKNFIVPEKFNRWYESLIDTSLNTIRLNNVLPGSEYNYSVRMIKNKPAFTMLVNRQDSDINFNVNITFSLEFDEWSFIKEHTYTSLTDWLAIPVEVNTGNWGYSFPKNEKSILSCNEHMKPTIRLIKKLRDMEKMPYLSSYYIKTLFMWTCKEENSQFWKRGLGELFVEMLNKLQEAIESDNLAFYWDKRCNLLLRLTENQKIDCKIKLMRALDLIEDYAIDKTPEKLRFILLTDEERNRHDNNMPQRHYFNDDDYNDDDDDDDNIFQNDTSYNDNNMLQTEGVGAGTGIGTGTGIAIAAAGIAAVVGGLFLYHQSRRRNE